MPRRTSVAVFIAICATCLLTPVVYVVHRRSRSAPTTAAPTDAKAELPFPQEAPAGPGIGSDKGPVPPDKAPRPASSARARKRSRILYRNTALGPDFGVLAALSEDGQTEYRGTLRCDRVHAAAGTGICLTAERGFLTTFAALIFDTGSTSRVAEAELGWRPTESGRPSPSSSAATPTLKPASRLRRPSSTPRPERRSAISRRSGSTATARRGKSRTSTSGE